MRRVDRLWLSKRPSMDSLLAKRQRALRAKATREEVLVRDALTGHGTRFIFQKGFLCKGHAVRIVDFMLPDHNILLEVDGKSHVGKEDFDAFRESQIRLSAKSYRFLRIKNSEVLANKKNLTQFILDRIVALKKTRLAVPQRSPSKKIKKGKKAKAVARAIREMRKMDAAYRMTVGAPELTPYPGEVTEGCAVNQQIIGKGGREHPSADSNES